MTLASVSSLRAYCSVGRYQPRDAANVLIFGWRQMAPRDAHCGCLLRQVRAFAGKKKDPTTQKNLSRKERRLQSREMQRKQKRGTETPKLDPAAKTSPWKDRLGRFLPRPRIPGGSSNFQKEHVYAVAKRVPLFLVLALLVTSDDTSPLKVDRAFGPSMLPTLHPLGDLCLRDTGAWQRALHINKDYQVGDVIAIKNLSGRGYSCKRIIGVEGDTVLHYGQYADLYKDREDLGIVPVHQPDSHYLSWSQDNDVGGSRKDITRTVSVPPSHVWVEGDNPLFSVDSRHFGPVPVESIRGRILMRIWPLWRKEGVKPSLVIMSRERPKPLTKAEALSGGYNLYRKSVPVEENPGW